MNNNPPHSEQIKNNKRFILLIQKKCNVNVRKLHKNKVPRMSSLHSKTNVVSCHISSQKTKHTFPHSTKSNKYCFWPMIYHKKMTQNNVCFVAKNKYVCCGIFLKKNCTDCDISSKKKNSKKYCPCLKKNKTVCCYICYNTKNVFVIIFLQKKNQRNTVHV